MTHMSMVKPSVGEHLSSLSDEQLADEITTWSGRIAAGEAKLLELVAEFDRREAWGGVGMLSCAHWLVWKTGLSPGAAREKVTVARALADLPLVAAALAEAAMSFSQARAVTRVATPGDQVRWVDLCRHSTAAQLERMVRGVRRVRRSEQDAADPELARWRTEVSSSYDEGGNRRIVVVPAGQAVLFDAALTQIQADLDRGVDEVSEEPDGGGVNPAGGVAVAPALDDGSAGTRVAAQDSPEAARGASADVSAETRPAARATLGDALIEMARRALEQASPARARRSKAALSVQVDPLSGWARLADGELLPPTSLSSVPSLRQVMKTLPGRGGGRGSSPLTLPLSIRLPPLTAADLSRADLGRTARLPNQALRDLLGTVDGERCRFPGCARHRRLHAHHVTHWSSGGPTDLANLVLLCSRHHTLVHQQGLELRLADDRQLIVTTVEETHLLHHPALPYEVAEDLDPDGRVSAQTLPPEAVVPRMDLGYCVSVLLQQSA